MSDKLKILKGIPTAAANDKLLRKAFDTFFALKHAVVEGEILNYSAKAEMLAINCKISTRTFWTRIELMRKAKLIRTKNGKLIFASWDCVCKKYNLPKYFYYIKPEIHENTKIEFILEAKAIKEAQLRRRSAFYGKVLTNKYAETEYRRITGFKKLSRTAVMEYAVDCFKNPSKYSENDTYFLSEYLNPDNNLSCNAISVYLNNRKSKSSGTYTKQKLARYKLITCAHRTVMSNERTRTSILGTVKWNSVKKQTFLILVDMIEVV
ncbi:MAG: hypothetical protein WCK02_16075 [Bacteroidota bacterium]